MNKIAIIVDSILGAAVVALFVLFFTVMPKAKKPAVQEIEAAGELLPIAVVNTDSILLHYTLDARPSRDESTPPAQAVTRPHSARV